MSLAQAQAQALKAVQVVLNPLQVQKVLLQAQNQVLQVVIRVVVL